MTDLVLDDPSLRDMLYRFVKDYVEAQHAIEITNVAGFGAFELILTIILTAVTGGAGVIAAVGSKTALIRKFLSVGNLLSEFAKATRQMKLKARERKAKSRPADFKDLETTETTAKKGTSGPKTTLVKETYGNNEAVWTLDENGLPQSVEATLKSTSKTTRSSAEKKTQSSIGGDSRLSDDDGGHIVGHRFMSDQGEKNLFPQNSNLNRGAYKSMENEWADWTDAGFEVKLKVDLDPLGSARPDNIKAQYEVLDPSTGEKVFKREHVFSNTSGEAFERVSKSDMSLYR